VKVIGLRETDLDTCINDAQHERIVITRDGKPVALVVGVEGLDTQQLELGSSAKFWELITRRRKQETVTRGQLQQKMRQVGKRTRKAAQPEATVGRASARKKRSPRPGGRNA
jgi:antitoxin (DNA-binding transcriptional repressor) of toxin-antitoxin stability system